MKRIILTIALVAALATPATAHHVEVAASDSDQDALVAYVNEYVAQFLAVKEMLALYGAAASGPEKADALLAVEGALIASVDHMASLDHRECFAFAAFAAEAEFAAAADAVTTSRASDGDPIDFTAANEARQVTVLAFGEVDCSEEALA